MKNRNIINIICNLICCSYFGYVCFMQYKILKQEFQIIELFVLTTCIILFFIILFRPVAIEGKFVLEEIIVCFISKFYYLLLDFSPNSKDIYIMGGELIFIVGTCFWIFSIMWLGNSFSILPAVRKIKIKGPYKLIRHPVYLSYIIIDIGLLLIFPSLWNISIIVIGIFCYLVRIRFEEKLLSKTQDYITYKKKVKFKLIPLLY